MSPPWCGSFPPELLLTCYYSSFHGLPSWLNCYPEQCCSNDINQSSASHSHPPQRQNKPPAQLHLVSAPPAHITPWRLRAIREERNSTPCTPPVSSSPPKLLSCSLTFCVILMLCLRRAAAELCAHHLHSQMVLIQPPLGFHSPRPWWRKSFQWAKGYLWWMKALKQYKVSADRANFLLADRQWGSTFNSTLL